MGPGARWLLSIVVALVACHSSLVERQTGAGGNAASTAGSGIGGGPATTTASGGAPNPCGPAADSGSLRLIGQNETVFAIATDGTDLFYSHQGYQWPGTAGAAPAQSMAIARVSLSRGGPTDIASGIASGSFAVAGDSVYFATPGQVSVAPKTGGAATTFVTDAGPIGVIASDGATVCWVSGATTVRCASIAAGGTTTVLDGSSIASLQVASGYAFAMESGAADAGGATTLIRVPVNGGDATTIAASDSPTFYVDRDIIVFWNNGELTKVPVTGGASASLGASGMGSELIADDRCAYWPAKESVQTAPLAGGAGPVDFALPELYDAVLVTQDVQALYVVEYGSGADTGEPLFLERFAKR